MRNIKIAITVDDGYGIAFNRRRQSRDKRIIKDLCEKHEDVIYVSEYSAPLFAEYPDRIRVVENPLAECPSEALAFVEKTHIGNYINEVSELIVYHWNTTYPSDLRLDVDLRDCGLKMNAKYEFTGNSHNKITKGIYKR